MPEEINAAMMEQLGLTTTVLFCAYDRYKDAEREDQHRVYALENHSPEVPLPTNGRWISQAELAGHVETLKATGCPDRRLYLLPGLYQEVLAATPFLLIDEPNGLPHSEHEQLLAFAPQLQEMCEELAGYKVPESLHHIDLHNGNILCNGETYTFIDAGEYCLAHPFCSMFIVLRVARYILEYDKQTLERLTEAYLAPWMRYEPTEE